MTDLERWLMCSDIYSEGAAERRHKRDDGVEPKESWFITSDDKGSYFYADEIHSWKDIYSKSLREKEKEKNE